RRVRQGDVLADRALHKERFGAIRRDVDQAGSDRVRGMAERDGRAVDQELAAAGPLRAGQDVEQLVLALTLERDDSEDLAWIQLERRVLEPRSRGQASGSDPRCRL